MSDAELIALYDSGVKINVCPTAVSRALARVGRRRDRCPQRARHRPQWWSEIKSMHMAGISFAEIGRCFGVHRNTVLYAYARVQDEQNIL